MKPCVGNLPFTWVDITYAKYVDNKAVEFYPSCGVDYLCFEENVQDFHARGSLYAKFPVSSLKIKGNGTETSSR